MKQTCKTIADVGFILDSSYSLRNDYDKEKDFLKAVAAEFGVSSNGSRAGVVTFSFYAKHSIKMNDHTDLASFNAAVDKIPLMGYNTRIDRSLRLTQKEMFSIANGGRPGVPKVLILLTDGTQSRADDAEDPGVVADELRKDGINIIVVGIGKGVNRTEIIRMAGGPDNAYTAASFSELVGSDFVNKIKAGSCQAAEVSVKPSCGSIVDVGFILDSSYSLRNDYDKEKDFLKALAATFYIGVNASRAGVVTFSYYTKHSIKLNDHADLASFNVAVDKIPLMGHTTRIDKALRLTQKEMFSIANGGRPGVPKVLILLTDGTQTPYAGVEDPGVVADELRKDGINIIVIGIGKGVSEEELMRIAGGPANAHHAASFSDLIGSDFVNKIEASGCKAASVAIKPSCGSIADVGFILDSSYSLRNDYDKEKEFIKALVATFGISSNGSRAGVVTFSFSSEHSIKMNNHTDLVSFNAAVDNIPLMGYSTRIDKALRLTQKEMFSVANGGRPGVPKVVILLTDGSQTNHVDAEDPGIVANELRNDGIKIKVVGIGKAVNQAQLVRIAGSSANTYNAASFDELVNNDFVNKIKVSGCQEDCADSEVYAESCSSFQASGYCQENSIFYVYMKSFCKRTCNLCLIS